METAWVYFEKDDIPWVSSVSEEEAAAKADLEFSHIYFFAELVELIPAD